MKRYLKWAILVAGVFLAGPAQAYPMFSAPVHQTIVLFHLFGAIIFMGNLVVTAMWVTNARRTRDASVVHYASRMVIRADWVFTLPGAILLVTCGVLALGPYGGFGKASWADLAMALFLLSGVIWTTLLIPLQKRMLRISREAVELNAALSDQFDRVYRRWAMWGGIATLLPFGSLYLMAFKPQLWGG